MAGSRSPPGPPFSSKELKRSVGYRAPQPTGSRDDGTLAVLNPLVPDIGGSKSFKNSRSVGSSHLTNFAFERLTDPFKPRLAGDETVAHFDSSAGCDWANFRPPSDCDSLMPTISANGRRPSDLRRGRAHAFPLSPNLERLTSGFPGGFCRGRPTFDFVLSVRR